VVTATARLFFRLSAASVCFSLIQAQHRGASVFFHSSKRCGDGASVYLFVRSVCLYFIILSATPRLRRGGGASVHFLFVNVFGAAASVCLFVCLLTRCGTAAFVCPFTHTAFFFGGGWRMKKRKMLILTSW
jgi:hypothetical protein